MRRLTVSRGRPEPSSTAAASSPIWQIPLALWVYGLLRSLAFAAPSWTSEGRIGLGSFVVIVLYVFVLRRSRRAWTGLVIVDTFSLVLLTVAWVDADNAPLAIPALAAVALVVLLAPSIRRHVAEPRPPAVARQVDALPR